MVHKTKQVRKMISVKNDDFYEQPYMVVDRIALKKFDPGNNSNKFYVAEVHQAQAPTSSASFRFFVNHGRVGANGAPKAEPFFTLEEAKSKYGEKVREKLRSGYGEVNLATVTSGSAVGKQKIDANSLLTDAPIVNTSSKLTPPVANLVKHLYEEANRAVSIAVTGSVKEDVRAPLGNLGVHGLNKARHTLHHLNKAINRSDLYEIRQLSRVYYQNVPRKLQGDLRDEATWLLSTKQRVFQELDILDLYEDMLRMLAVSGTDLDTHYDALNCDIMHVLNPDVVDYITNKVATTHASNHNYKLKVKNIFEVNLKNAPKFNDSCGNVRRLFHGSRSANLLGILSSHLKLPQNLDNSITKTGAMFGSGIYFAHDCTKSANYSFGSFSGRPNKYKSSFLMVCEVALGNVHKVSQPQNFSAPPQGYHSVMGVKGAHLVNHEFIVYSPSQVRVRYLVEVEKH